jgi:hypothetical protein
MKLRNYTDKVIMIFNYYNNPLYGATLSSDKAEYTQTDSGSVLLTLKVNYLTNYNDTIALTTALNADISYDFSQSTVDTSIKTGVTDDNGADLLWFNPAHVTAEFATDKPDDNIYVLSVSVIVNYAAMTSSNRLATQLYLTVEDTTSSETKNPTVVKVIDTNSTTGTVDINIAEYSVSGDQSNNLKVKMDELIMTVSNTDERYNQPVIVYYNGTDKPDKNKLVEYGILDMEEKRVNYTPYGVSELKNALMANTINDYVATDGMMTITYETDADSNHLIVIKANPGAEADDLKFEAVASASDADKLLITSNALYEVSSEIVFSADQQPDGSNYTEYTIDGSVRVNAFFTGSDEDGAIAQFNAFDVTKCSNISQDGSLKLLVVNNFADTLDASTGASGSQWVIQNNTQGNILEGTISADGTALLVKLEDGHPVVQVSTLSDANKYRKCEVERYIMAKDPADPGKIMALLPQIMTEQSIDLTATLDGMFNQNRLGELKTHVVNQDAGHDKTATFGEGVVFGGLDEQAIATIESESDNLLTTVTFSNVQRNNDLVVDKLDLANVNIITPTGDILQNDSPVIVQASVANLFTTDSTFNEYLHGDGNNNVPPTHIIKVKITKVGSDYKVVFIKSDESDGASIVLTSSKLNQNLKDAIGDGSVTVDFNKFKHYTETDATADLTHNDVSIIHENDANTNASAVLLKNTGNDYAISINNFNNLKLTTYQTFKQFIQQSGYLTGTGSNDIFETPLLTSNEPLNTTSALQVISDYNNGGANYNHQTKGVVIKGKLVMGSAKIIKVGSTYDFVTNDMVVYVFVDFIDAVKEIAADINTLMLDNTFIVNTSDVPTVASHSLTITNGDHSLTVRNVSGINNLTTVRDTILKTSDRYTVELDEHCGDNSALSEQFDKYYYPYESELVATVYKTVGDVKTSLLKVRGLNKVSDNEYNATNAVKKLEDAYTFTHNAANADMKSVLSLESAKVVSIGEFVTILMDDTGNLVNGFNTAAHARYGAEFAYYVQSMLSSVPAQMAATKTMTDDMLTLSTLNNTNIGELKGDINALGVTLDGINIVDERTSANDTNNISAALVDAIEQDSKSDGDVAGKVPSDFINSFKSTSNALDKLLVDVLYNRANGTVGNPSGFPVTDFSIIDPHPHVSADAGNLWKSLYNVQKEIINMATTLETDVDNLYKHIKDEVVNINKAIRYTNQMSYYADVALMRLLIRLRTIQNAPQPATPDP